MNSLAQSGAPAPQEKQYSRMRSWYAVGLLTLLYAIAAIDRMILALLAQPLMADLQIDQAQMGVLIGAAFAVVYSFAGLPLGYAVDRWNRRSIVALGVCIWSVATVGSGFASSYWSLLALRGGVALGEAVLTPAAISLIADMFPPKERALPVAVYASASNLLSIGAFILGGALYEFAPILESATHLEMWRATLVVVGLPGLLLGPVFFLTIREPPRSERRRIEKSNVGRYLKANWRFYAPFFVATACSGVMSVGLLSWGPSALMLTYGFSPAQAGYWFGAAGLAGAIIASCLWPWLTARLQRVDRTEGSLTILLVSIGIAVPALVALPLAYSSDLFLGLTFLAVAGLFGLTPLAPLTIQMFAPNEMTARLTALYMFSVGLIGYATGPSLVVAFSTPWENEPTALIAGIAVNGLVVGVLCFSGYFMARTNAASTLKERNAREHTVLEKAPLI